MSSLMRARPCPTVRFPWQRDGHEEGSELLPSRTLPLKTQVGLQCPPPPSTQLFFLCTSSLIVFSAPLFIQTTPSPRPSERQHSAVGCWRRRAGPRPRTPRPGASTPPWSASSRPAKRVSGSYAITITQSFTLNQALTSNPLW